MTFKDQVNQQLQGLIVKGNKILSVEESRQKIVGSLYIIMSLAALSFFGIFAIGPTVTTISQLQKQHSEGQTVLENLTRKNGALQQLAVQYASIESDASLILNAIPETPRIPELSRQLEMLANRNNLALTKLDFGIIELYPAKKAVSPIFSYNFTMSVEGSETNINKFIGEIISIERMISIERLVSGKEKKNISSASITGRAFFYKNVQAAAAKPAGRKTKK